MNAYSGIQRPVTKCAETQKNMTMSALSIQKPSIWRLYLSQALTKWVGFHQAKETASTETWERAHCGKLGEKFSVVGT